MSAPVCHYCGGVAEEDDHIVPKHMGGDDARDNLVPTCRPCNSRKSGRWPTCACSRCAHAIRRFVAADPNHAIQCVLRQKLADVALLERRRWSLDVAVDRVGQAAQKLSASSTALDYVDALAQEVVA